MHAICLDIITGLRLDVASRIVAQMNTHWRVSRRIHAFGCVQLLSYLDARALSSLSFPLFPEKSSTMRVTHEIAGIFNSTVYAHVRQANALDKQELINHREFATGVGVYQSFPPQNVNWWQLGLRNVLNQKPTSIIIIYAN